MSIPANLESLDEAELLRYIVLTNMTAPANLNSLDTAQLLRYMIANGFFSGGGGGSGSVTNVSVVNANGFSGSVANPTTAPAITLALSGILPIAGATVRTPAAMPALAVDVTQGNNTKTIAADSALTFSGTPANSEQWFSLRLTNSDTNPHTISIPSSYSMGRQGMITSFVIPASGKLFLTWEYDGAIYNLYNDPNLFIGTGSYVLSSIILQAEVTLTDGTTITQTMVANQADQNAKVTLGGNRTLAFSGLAAGMRGNLRVIQDGTGSRTLALPASSRVNGSTTTVTLLTAAAAENILSWYSPDGTAIRWTNGTY